MLTLLEGTNPRHVTTSFLHVTNLVHLAAHHLSIKLPAQILLPTSEYPDPAILSPTVSYTANTPILPTPSHSKHSSPTASRHTDGSQPRARPLFLRKPLAMLAKENPLEYAHAVEGITLLAWNVAWLCRTQGLDVGTQSWEEICAIGKNLYDLLLVPAKARNSETQSSQPTEAGTPNTPMSVMPSPLPPGYFSHGTVYGFLGSPQGVRYMQAWRFSNPVKVIDKVKQALLAERTGAEWEILEGNEWAHADMTGGMHVMQLDEKADASKQQSSSVGVDQTGILLKPNTKSQPMTPKRSVEPMDGKERSASGWYKMRGR